MAVSAPSLSNSPVSALQSPSVTTTTSDLGWQPPAALNVDGLHNTWLGGVSLSSGGTGMVLWQRDAAHSEVYATRYVPNGGGDGGSDWQVPVRLSNGQDGAYGGTVGLDASGNAIAIWYQWTDTYGFQVFAAHYNVGVGWAAPVDIDQSSFYSYYYLSEIPQVVVNAGGTAFAVWQVFNGYRWSIYGNRFAPSGGWGTAVKLDNSTINSGNWTYNPRVGVDNAGNAMVTWYEIHSSTYRVVYVRYTAATSSWSAPVQLNPGLSYALGPSVSTDAAGTTAFTWIQWAAPYHIWATICQEASCGAPTQVETNPNGANCCRAPSISENAGTVFVTWDAYDGTDTGVYVNRYVSGAWGAYQLLVDYSTTIGPSQAPAVVTDGSGNAVLVFLQTYAAQPLNIYQVQSERYINGTGWQGIYSLEYQQNGGYGPLIAMDASGNALSVWNFNEQTNPTAIVGIFGNIYTSGTGWLPYYDQQAVEYDQYLSIGYLQIESNMAGQAVATWVQDDGVVWNAYASIYNPSSGGWGMPTQIEHMELGGATEVWSAIDAAGDVIAVYRVYDGVVWGLYASRYTPSGGWAAPVRIDSLAGDQFWPRIAMDPAGNALVVWSEYTGSNWNIYANRYSAAGSSWQGAVKIQVGTGYASGDEVAMDSSGNGFAVWDQENTTTFYYQAYAARYVAGSGWQTPVVIEQDTSSASNVGIGMSRNGASAAVWAEWSGSNYQTHANVYTPGVGWRGEVLIVGGSTNSGWGTPALDDAGNVVVPWYVWGTNQFDAYITRYVPGSGWGSPVALSTLAGDASIPVAALDPRGNGYVLWRQWNGMENDIYARRYLADGSLGAAIKVDITGQDAGGPLVSVDGAGDAFASWGQWNTGVYVPWVAEYVVGDGAPSLTVTSPTGGLTNRSSVTVQGSTDPGATVTIDGTSETVSATGAFSGTFALSDGTHNFTVVARNAAGTNRTVTASVTVDTTPPALALTAPTNGANMAVPTVLVTGTTEPGAQVVVNGYAVSVSGSGAFSMELALSPGANAITVTATDAAGNARSRTVAVAYSNPVPGLQQQLNQTSQLLNATRQDLANARQATSNTNAALNDTKASLGTLGTETLILVVLVVVSIAFAAVQFLTVRKLRSVSPKTSAPPEEKKSPPT